MKSILIIIRAEGDFERAVAIGISTKKTYNLNFVYIGDVSSFFSDGIRNKFQKKLFTEHGFIMHDFLEFSFFGKILSYFSLGRFISFEEVQNNKRYILPLIFNRILSRYLSIFKKGIIKKMLNKITPDVLFTDQSQTFSDYLPEMIRKEANIRKIPIYIFTHGAAGGLHSEFTDPTFDKYEGYTVLACNTNETNPNFKNRIILGDMSSSYPYVNYMNKIQFEEINFLNDRKYKVGLFVGGTGPFTSTTGWFVQEEIIIELSENSDVAMVLKVHPREEPFIDLRMLEKFDNLLIVNKETDRSRVSKWADIVICSDHCSTIFEPMILGKKVVAIEGKHIPKYKNNHSPLKDSSVNFIKDSSQFELDLLQNADPYDKVTNAIAWGGNGDDDLAALIPKIIEDI